MPALCATVVMAGSPGSVAPTFNIGAGSVDAGGDIFGALPLADGKLFVNGDFTNFNGTPVHYFVRLNSDGSIDQPFMANITNEFGPNMPSGGSHPGIAALLVKADGRILLGGVRPQVFPGLLDYSCGYALLLQLDTSGAEDSSFTTQMGGPGQVQCTSVRGLALDVFGEILAFGYFGEQSILHFYPSGQPADFRLNLQAAPGQVQSLTTQPDGHILIQGHLPLPTASASNPTATSLSAVGSIRSMGSRVPAWRGSMLTAHSIRRLIRARAWAVAWIHAWPK